MNSTSHKSFSSRLGNAQSITTIMESFTDYVPPKQEVSVDAIQAQIGKIQELMNQHNAAQLIYREAVQQRVLLFDKEDDSVTKLLSPIGTFVRALLGEDSSVYQELNRIIKRMRGASKPIVSSEEDDSRHISTVERTYDSRTQDFNLLVNVLEGMGEAYNPPNAMITLAVLKAKLIAIREQNTAVGKALTVLKPLIKERQEMFTVLTQQTQDAKNFVKAQYGIQSTEYKQIKSFVV